MHLVFFEPLFEYSLGAALSEIQICELNQMKPLLLMRCKDLHRTACGDKEWGAQRIKLEFAFLNLWQHSAINVDTKMHLFNGTMYNWWVQ